MPAMLIDLPSGWRLDARCGHLVGESTHDCRSNDALVDCTQTQPCDQRVGELQVFRQDPPLTSEAAVEDLKRLYVELGRRELRTEALRDGWVLTYAGGEHGDTFPVRARRDLSGMSINCSVEATTPARQRDAVAACKSLRLAAATERDVRSARHPGE